MLKDCMHPYALSTGFHFNKAATLGTKDVSANLSFQSPY